MRWFSTLSISLVLVMAAVGGYYVYYVEARMGMQHEEKLRSLGSVAKLFENRLGSLTSQIRNTPYLNLKLNKQSACSEDDPVDLAMRRQIQECKTRERILERMKSLKPTFSFESFKPIDEIEGKPLVRSATYITRDINGADDLLVRTVYDTEVMIDPWAAKLEPLWDKYDIRVRTSFKKLFSGDLDSNLAFDKILLLDENFDVLYQGGELFPRFTDVSTLIATVLENGTRVSRKVSGYSDVHKVHLGDKTFFAYLHPLELELLDGGVKEVELSDGSQKDAGRIEWLAVGLVDESRFRSTTLSVSALPLILFGSLLILGILSAPFVKTLMMGSSDKVSTQDLRSAGLFGIALVGIVIILIMVMADSLKIGAHYSHRLELIAEQFHQSLKVELDEIKLEVVRLSDEKRRKINNQIESSCDSKSNSSHIDAELICEKKSISRLVFINKDGRQEYKFQKSSKNRTPLVDVSGRQYFSGPNERMKAENFKCSDKSEILYTLESIISYNSGAKYSMMGIPGECLGATQEDGAPVHVVSAVVDIKTLQHAYLPVGISYAIVDGDGQVLYHTQSSKNLDENLLDEIPERNRLLAIMSVDSQTTSQLEISYYGQRYRVHHKKLDFLDAHLLIMEDLSLVDATSLEIAATSYAIFMLYVLFIAAVVISSILTYETEKASWFWPDNKLSNPYFRAALVLLVFMFWNITSLRIAQGYIAYLLLASQAVLISSVLVSCFERGISLSYRRVRLVSGVFSGISGIVLVVANLYMISRFMDNDKDVVSSNLFFAAYILSFTMTAGLLFCVLRYPSKISDGWFENYQLTKQIPRLYRTRIYFYGVVILTVINLSVIPAVNIYWNARDSGLLRLLKIDQTAEKSWRENLTGPMSKEEREASKEQTEVIRFGGDYVQSDNCDSTIEESNCEDVEVRLPPDYFTRLLPFTVNNRWQQNQLDARTRLNQLDVSTRPLVMNREKLALSAAKGPSDTPYVLEVSEGGAGDTEYTVGNPRSYLSPMISGYVKVNADDKIKWVKAVDKSALLIDVVVICLLAGLLFLFVLYLRWFCRNILGLYSWNQLPVRFWGNLDPNRSCLWLYPDEELGKMLAETPLEVPVENQFDINKCLNPGVPPAFSPGDSSRPVLIANLEACLLNPAVATQVLYELERQVYGAGHRMILTSKVDPLPFIIEDSRHLYLRWSHLLSDFGLIQGQHTVPDEFVERINSMGFEDHIVKVARIELGWHPELRDYLEVYESRMKGLLEKQCVRLLVNPQKAFCIYLWNLSTIPEKRVLYQLAKGNLVNPGQWEVVLKLQARGLVVRDPLVHLVSAGLQRSILQSVTKEESSMLDRPEEVSMWGMIRFPLLVLIALSGLFLFVTQKDLFDLTVGVAMGAVVALPAITRFFAMLGNSSSSGSKESGVA